MQCLTCDPQNEWQGHSHKGEVLEPSSAAAMTLSLSDARSRIYLLLRGWQVYGFTPRPAVQPGTVREIVALLVLA